MAIESRFILRGENRTDPAFKGVNKNLKKTEGGLNKLKGAAVAVFAALAGGALVRGNVAAYAQQEQAVAALDASIGSMGRTTNGLSKELQALASQIQGEGILGDEAIIQGQSFLTTYSAITDQLLPRTTRLMADLAAKMGGDTKSAANLLGKASLGMVGELARVGITLSESTKKSKDFGAILTEIEQQVGGMNKALGDTASGGMKQFANAWGDIREDAGGVIALGLADHMRDLARVMGEGTGVAVEWGGALRNALYTVQGVLVVMASEFGVMGHRINLVFDSIVAVSKAAFENMMGGLKGSIATALDYMAAVQDRLPWSDTSGIKQYSAELRASAAAVKPVSQALLEVVYAHEKEVLISREAAALTVEDIENKRNQKKATDAVADSTKKLGVNVVALSAADKESSENRKGFLALMSEGEKITRASRTELEVYSDEISRLNGLWQAGAIDSEVYGSAVLAAQESFVSKSKDQATVWGDAWTSAGNRFAAGIGDAVASSILDQESFASSARSLAKGVIRQVISSLVEIGIKKTALWILEKTQLAATTAAVVGSNVAIAASAAPAAAGVSLATAGANSVPAATGVSALYALTAGLAVAGQAHSGLDYVPREGSYILDKGEMVLDKGTSAAVRNAAGGGGGGAVYVSVPINIRALDAKGVQAVIRNNRGLFASMTRTAVNDALRSSGRRALV